MEILLQHQNYLSLDLEINADGNGWVGDIIQVGIAIGNPCKGVYFDEDIFIKPYNITNNGILTPYIKKLTGITQERFDLDSVTLSDCSNRIKMIVEEYNTFVNPVQWGLDDSHILLEAFKFSK